MERIIVIVLGVLMLVGCNGNQNVHSDTTELESESDWMSFEEIVFPSPKEDTAYIIPDNVYATDWMRRYVQFIEKNFVGEEGIWTRTTEEESFDCRYWSLAYVDEDTIPEMLLYGGCLASGAIILSQFNGIVQESPKGGFMFIEGGKGLLHSQQMHSGEIWGAVYEMIGGQFVERVNYYCFTGYYDTTEIDKYGLDREFLSGWLMEDGTVGISGIKINDIIVDASFGIDNWSAGTLKPVMDSLYYKSGVSTLFPKPEELRSIGELLMSKSH